MGTFLYAALAVTYGADRPWSKEQKARNDGFYLLHDLCSNEADVDKLMLIKTAPPEIGRYTKELAAEGAQTLAMIDQFQDQDKNLVIDQNPLPPIENEVRAEVADEAQHCLLFGTSGAAFVRALIHSQIEAADYAEHLAYCLERHAGSDGQRQALEKISRKWGHLEEEGYDLLGGPAAR